jgi:hypothetical protein
VVPQCVNWAKSGASASALLVAEIADPHAVPFPGFDRLLISYAELMALAEDSRYASWHTSPRVGAGGLPHC